MTLIPGSQTPETVIIALMSWSKAAQYPTGFGVISMQVVVRVMAGRGVVVVVGGNAVAQENMESDKERVQNRILRHCKLHVWPGAEDLAKRLRRSSTGKTRSWTDW